MRGRCDSRFGRRARQSREWHCCLSRISCAIWGAFPNIEVIVEDVIAEGDKVVARCSVRGKHTGESLGTPATQSDIEFTGIAIVRVGEDVKISEAWNNFDFLKMNQQLGIL